VIYCCFLLDLSSKVYRVKSVVVLLSILTLFACKSENKNEENTKIDRIVLASGGCYGQCPYQALDITENLKVNYFGGEFSKLEGDFHSNIKQIVWDTICKRLNELEYNECDSIYDNSVDDQSIELIIYYGNKKKHIKGQSASFPEELNALFYEIIHLTKTMDMKKSKKAYQFPTNFQIVEQIEINFLPPLPETE
jgi:hypothetical protein